MSSKIKKEEIYLPIFASVKVSFVKKDGWEAMTKEQKIEYITDHFEIEGSLCCHCSKSISTDLDIDYTALNRYIEDSLNYI